MKFRKKPVVIDAIQWTGDNLVIILRFMGQKVDIGSNMASDRFDDYRRMVKESGFKINTLEGTMSANIGDYIIKGVNGEFYPCKPDIFEKTYDEIVDASVEINSTGIVINNGELAVKEGIK